MRRFFTAVMSKPNVRYGSFGAGLFHFKVIPEELVPYPTHLFGEDEGENLVALNGLISKPEKSDLFYHGARIATEYGGLGLGATAYAFFCEALGRSGSNSLFSAIQSSSLSVYLISTFGSKEQKGKHLTKMSDGSEVFGWAIQEEHGSDVSMSSTTAKYDDGKFIINGKKVCRFVDSATHFLVLAKSNTQIHTDDGPKESQRSSVFIIDRKANGVTVTDDCLILDGVEAEDVVGTVGEGFRLQLITSLTEQYACAAAALGTLKACCQEVRGGMNGSASAAHLAYCMSMIYAMESCLYALTSNMDRQSEDILIDACFTYGFIVNTTQNCVRMLSAVAPISANHSKSLSMLLSIMEHPDFFNAAAVSSGVEEYGLSFQATSTAVMIQRRFLRSLGIKEKLPIQEVDCNAISAGVVNFGNAVETTFVRNTTSLAYQQMLLNRLGEAGQLLYAASATASRAAMAMKKGVSTAKVEKSIAEAFIPDAIAKATTLCNECRNIGLTADEISKRIALELCDEAAR